MNWPALSNLHSEPICGRGRAGRLAALLLLIGLAGCSTIGPYQGPITSTTAGPSAEPSTPDVVTAEAEPEPLPASVTPAPSPPAPATIAPPTRRILVVRSSDAENYLSVAQALLRSVPENYELVELNLADSEGETTSTNVGEAEWDAAVAIGADAASYAATRVQIPVIVCQIFDFEPLLEQNENFIAVEPLPPLELQLRSWQQIDPTAASVGIIVTADETELTSKALEAAEKLGLDLHTAVAATDRDALYQFKRFADNVDALWLQPLGSILSPTVIQEMLDYALGHRVQTIVFNPSLLDWGALLSVGSNTDDVAASIAQALDAIVSGNGADLQRALPLSAVDVHFNEAVAGQLGVFGPSEVARAKQLVTLRDDDS
jgi:ABC-type uncharacterized transport system substrate-binding protein